VAAMQLADKGGILFNFEAISRYWLNSAQPAGFLEFVVERALGVAGAGGAEPSNGWEIGGLLQRGGRLQGGGDRERTMAPPTTGP